MANDQLTTEILSGGGLTLPAAAKILPPHRGEGECTSHVTLWRWVTVGARAADGRTVKLEAVRLGSRWLTSRPAIGRFMAALTVDAPATTPDHTASERQRAAEAAARRLEAAGA